MRISESQINIRDVRALLRSLRRFLRDYDRTYRDPDQFVLSEADAEYLLMGFANVRCILEHVEEGLDKRSTRALLKLRVDIESVVNEFYDRLMRVLTGAAAGNDLSSSSPTTELAGS